MSSRPVPQPRPFLLAIPSLGHPLKPKKQLFKTPVLNDLLLDIHSILYHCIIYYHIIQYLTSPSQPYLSKINTEWSYVAVQQHWDAVLIANLFSQQACFHWPKAHLRTLGLLPTSKTDVCTVIEFFKLWFGMANAKVWNSTIIHHPCQFKVHWS